MQDAEKTVAAREESMRAQLAGASAAVTADEAATGLAAAERELAEGRGAGYGVGFGYVKKLLLDEPAASRRALEFIHARRDPHAAQCNREGQHSPSALSASVDCDPALLRSHPSR